MSSRWAPHLTRAHAALRMVFTPTNAACAAPIIMVALLGWHQRWISDDGWINIRVVEQVLAGNGPVYNAGERVEVTTSTLWFGFLLAGAYVLPSVEPQVTGAVMGWILTIAGMTFASLGAGQLFRSRRPVMYVPVGMLAVAALPPMWDFTTSGLETGLSFAWLGGCFWMLAHRAVAHEDGARRAHEDGARRPAWWPLWPAFVIGLGPLVRPDFALYSVLFAVGLLMSSRLRWSRWWDWPITLVLALAVPAAYQVFRMGFYAALVPNTALAKDATDTRWQQGLIYLVDYAGLYVLMVPLVVGALGTGLHMTYAWRTRGQARWAVVGAPLLGAAMHVAYIVRVGGDFMHARFLLPDTFAVLMPAAVVGITIAWRQLALVATAFVAGWAVAIASSARTPYTDAASDDGIANEREFWAAHTITGDLLTRADWLAGGLGQVGTRARWDHEAGWSYYDNGSVRLDSATGEGVYIAVQNLGIISIAAGTEVTVVDKLALSDGITSHSVFDPRLVGDTRVGHAERPDAWRVARYARFRIDEPDRITHARLALQCGDLAVLQDAISGELTEEKFWANVRLSPRLTFFTFPADPATARKELCGWAPGW
ncbi:hypothetical protein [Granulicoccus sp. GXG6511]|uniref:hypothetical protein n=1 Tax=Granulicoccus sp. GXG6511 TaxID=3381351 RepID=UPI003D7E5090